MNTPATVAKPLPGPIVHLSSMYIGIVNPLSTNDLLDRTEVRLGMHESTPVMSMDDEGCIVHTYTMNNAYLTGNVQLVVDIVKKTAICIDTGLTVNADLTAKGWSIVGFRAMKTNTGRQPVVSKKKRGKPISGLMAKLLARKA